MYDINFSLKKIKKIILKKYCVLQKYVIFYNSQKNILCSTADYKILCVAAERIYMDR